MLIRTLPLGYLETNCYLIAAEPGAEAAVIDPADDAAAIMEAARRDNLRITHILLTHGHFDHILGLAELKQLTQARVGIHAGDEPMLHSAQACYADYIGLPYSPCTADFLIEDGQRIAIGALELLALHTPGHTPGGLSFYAADSEDESGAVFSGDALFKGAIGRTDLPGGNEATLLRSIEEKLFTLPDETRVYPGHGPSSLIGIEKRGNPFFSDR